MCNFKVKGGYIMSTNRKNIIRKAPLANFTRNIKYRDFVVDRSTFNQYCDKIPSIMADVNKTIQEVALNIEDRHIPFVIGSPITYDAPKICDSRIVLLPAENKFALSFTNKERRNISHLVEFQLSAIYNQITFSNSSCDAKLVIDKEFLIPTATDLFLDLAMFNSYSFLQDMSVEEKREFSKQKFEYFKHRNLPCYYTYDNSDILLYYSLAFSARKTLKKIDIPMYIALWEDFLRTYYPGKLHMEPSLESQLKQHIDFGQLPCQKILDELDSRPNGSYLLIRLNRRPRSTKMATELNTILGGSTLSSKSWKIISLSEYSTIKQYTQNLYISAFKLIKA